MKQIVLGITGASGAAYSVALAKLLAAADCQVQWWARPWLAA